MPKPVSLLVGSTSGWAAPCLRAIASAAFTARAREGPPVDELLGQERGLEVARGPGDLEPQESSRFDTARYWTT